LVKYIDEISGAIYRGLDFITSRLDLSHSVSSMINAFVSYAISGEVNTKYFIGILGNLASQQRPNGGWRSINSSHSDPYTTAWGLLALSSSYSILRPSAIERAIYYLERHQNKRSGGFVNRNLSLFPYYSGGYSDEQCDNNTTSISILSLLAQGIPIDNMKIRMALEYLKKQRDKRGIWILDRSNSYAYSTYNSLKILNLCNSLTTEEAKAGIQYLLYEQGKNGGWNDSYCNESDVLGTSFAVMSLFLFINDKTKSASKRAIQWLINQQNDNGCWSTERAFVLLPSIHSTSNCTNKGGFLDITTREILSTASAIWALKLFKSIFLITRTRFFQKKTSSIMGDIRNSVNCCLDFLERQRSLGYFEAEHLMGFPVPNFPEKTSIHAGLTFQRAIICDALLGATHAGFPVNVDDIKKDINEIIKARCRSIRGGWKYFPSLSDLPPDADDLGQILQVLVRGGCSYIPELCDDAIQLLFKENSHSNGSFETWIVDKNDRSTETKLILEAINKKWGRGPDVEVMANLLYGLWLYDYSRYAKIIDKGVEFIIKNQRPEGFWSSTWYYGNYYGTYVCTRILNASRTSNLAKINCLKKTRQFLVDSQTKQGGWGMDRESPVDTALGIMTMIELKSSGITMKNGIVKNAANFLLQYQWQDGRWYDSNFIRMDTTRATIGGDHKTSPNFVKYGSDTIASAICTKSLCQVYDSLTRQMH
jgi:prenyltransferase beta subunit